MGSLIWDEPERPARVDEGRERVGVDLDCSEVFRRLAEWHDHDVRPEHVRARLLELGYAELS